MSILDMVNEAFDRRFRGSDADLRTDNQRVHDGMREPGTRVYGHRGTLDDNEALNIVLDPNGDVLQVWFRCQELPFNLSPRRRADPPTRGLPRLVAVEVID